MDKKAGSGLDARESGSRVSGLLILLSVCMLFCAVLSLPGCSDPGASTDEDGGSARASQEGKETDQTEPSTEIDLDSMDFEYLERDKDASYDVKTATSIIFDGESAQVKGEGAVADGSTVTISEEGCFVVSGTTAKRRLPHAMRGLKQSRCTLTAATSA